MYGKEVEKYNKCGLTIIPLRGKVPIVKGWMSGEVDMEELGERYSWANVGLVMGELVAIDIDVEEGGLKEEIEGVMRNYPTPVMRYGKRTRLPTYFYMSPGGRGGVPSLKLGGLVELLSTGRQCVIPPSIHPDGYAYEWVSMGILEAYERGVIPEYCEDLWRDLEVVFNGRETRGWGQSGEAKTGRHNRLISMCFAMLEKGGHPSEIARELFSEDLRLHSNNPYFLDQSEGHKGRGLESAKCMVRSCARTYIEKALNEEPIKVEVEEAREEEEEEGMEGRPKVEFPRLYGVMGDIYEAILVSSYKKRPILSMASAMAIWGAIIGNRFHFENTFSNEYYFLLAPTGSGKERPLGASTELFSQLGLHSLHGLGATSGNVTTFSDLDKRPVRLDVIDEAHGMFQTGSNQSLLKTIGVYNTLYTKAGAYYKGHPIDYVIKGERVRSYVGACFSPCVSVIAATTPEGFKDSFTMNFFLEGLGNRFLYFIEKNSPIDNPRPPRLRAPASLEYASQILHPMGREGEPLPFIPINKLESPSYDVKLPGCFGLICSEKALAYYDSIINELDEQNTAYEGTKMSAIYARLNMHFTKAVLLQASSRAYLEAYHKRSQAFTPEVIIEDISWARQFINAYVQHAEFVLSLAPPKREAKNLRDAINHFISEKGLSGAPLAEIKSNFIHRFKGSEISQVLKELIDDNVIQVFKNHKNSPGRKAYVYRIAKK